MSQYLKNSKIHELSKTPTWPQNVPGGQKCPNQGNRTADDKGGMKLKIYRLTNVWMISTLVIIVFYKKFNNSTSQGLGGQK